MIGLVMHIYTLCLFLSIRYSAAVPRVAPWLPRPEFTVPLVTTPSLQDNGASACFGRKAAVPIRPIAKVQLSCTTEPDSEELCDFESECGLYNVESTNYGENPQFAVHEGPPDYDSFNSCFDTKQIPMGAFAALAVKPSYVPQFAVLTTCEVECAETIEVELSHWQTTGIVLEVCSVDHSSRAESECIQVSSISGGPDKVELKGCESCAVIIKASGFIEDQDSVVALDDFAVRQTVCVTTAEPEATTAEMPPIIPCCNFNADTCDFEIDENGDENSWKRVIEDDLTINRFGNRDTGVPYEDTARDNEDDTEFMGVVLPNERISTAFHMKLEQETTTNETLTFYYYEATENCFIEICLNDDCEVISDKGVTEDQRVWMKGNIEVKEGVDKISFNCVSEDIYHCACGIDGISVAGKEGACDVEKKDNENEAS